MTVPDAIVIGAGIVGCACARALALAGLEVLVVDGNPGNGATSAGMGHILVVDDDPHLLALTRRGRALWEALAASLPAAVEWTRAGTLWVAETHEDMAAAQDKAERLAGAGVDAELVGPVALRRLEPCLAADLPGGLRVPGDRILYPPAAAAWLLEEARDAGARTQFGVAVRAITSGAVELANGARLTAGVIINAAGMHAADIMPGTFPVPIVPRKGHLLITVRHDLGCTHQLVELGYQRSAHGSAARSVAFNLQPRPTGQLLVGSSRQYGAADRSLDRSIVSDMLQRAIRFVPALAGLVGLRVWTGVRAATPDKRPLIGPVPGAPRVIMAAGHEGLGITTALATAELVSDHVLDRRSMIDPRPFGIDGIEGVRATA